MPPGVRRRKKRTRRGRRVGVPGWRRWAKFALIPAVVALGLGFGYLNAAAWAAYSRHAQGGAAGAAGPDRLAGTATVTTLPQAIGTPVGLAVDRDGTLYVSDSQQCAVRLVDRDGVMVLIAGGTPGYADGWYDKARFAGPDGLAVAAGGNIYVADRAAHCVRRISRKTGVATLAGKFDVDEHLRPVGGFSDGGAAEARFNQPRGLAIGYDGAVFIADSGNASIRRLLPGGLVETLVAPRPAGAAPPGDALPGLVVPSGLQAPVGLATGPGDVLYISEPSLGKVWRLQSGSLTLFAAGLAKPTGIAVGSDGAVYVAETGRNRIARLGPGTLTVVAGGGEPALRDGPGAAASFNAPEGLAIDDRGMLYVADAGNRRVRLIRPGNQTGNRQESRPDGRRAG